MVIPGCSTYQGTAVCSHHLSLHCTTMIAESPIHEACNAAAVPWIAREDLQLCRLMGEATQSTAVVSPAVVAL